MKFEATQKIDSQSESGLRQMQVEQRTVRCLEKHLALAKKVTAELYQQFQATPDRLAHFPRQGVYHGVAFERRDPYQSGKHQPVMILHLSFSDGEQAEFVCREDKTGRFGAQQESAVLQQVLPRMYFEEAGVVAIEEVKGIEGEQVRTLLIEHPEKNNDLAQQYLKLAEQLHQAGFSIVDVQVANGHNVKVDLTGQLHLFDIDSIQISNRSYAEESLVLIEGLLPDLSALKRATTEDKQRSVQQDIVRRTRFFMAYVRAFRAKHPDGLTYLGEMKRHLTAVDSGYQDAYQKFVAEDDPDDLGAMAEYGYPVPVRLRGQIGLDPALVSLCLKEDVKGCIAFLEKNAGFIYSISQAASANGQREE